ncbi:unnamed protein product [Rotaria sp. Silwood1]|nr:unnamed protein product [Rotaria sp. Silwood1]
MTLCGENEHDLRQVITYMKNQNGSGVTDLRTLATIIWKMGKFDLAEKYYLRFIKEVPTNDLSLITIYENLGEIASHKGDYDMSIQWYNKALEIKSANSSSTDVNVHPIANLTGRFIGIYQVIKCISCMLSLGQLRLSWC